MPSVCYLKCCIKWANNLSQGSCGSVKSSYVTPTESIVCKGKDFVKKRGKKVLLRSLRLGKKTQQTNKTPKSKRKNSNAKIINWNGHKSVDGDKQHFQDYLFSSIPLEQCTCMYYKPLWMENMGKHGKTLNIACHGEKKHRDTYCHPILRNNSLFF